MTKIKYVLDPSLDTAECRTMALAIYMAKEEKQPWTIITDSDGFTQIASEVKEDDDELGDPDILDIDDLNDILEPQSYDECVYEVDSRRVKRGDSPFTIKKNLEELKSKLTEEEWQFLKDSIYIQRELIQAVPDIRWSYNNEHVLNRYWGKDEDTSTFVIKNLGHEWLQKKIDEYGKDRSRGYHFSKTSQSDANLQADMFLAAVVTCQKGFMPTAKWNKARANIDISIQELSIYADVNTEARGEYLKAKEVGVRVSSNISQDDLITLGNWYNDEFVPTMTTVLNLAIRYRNLYNYFHHKDIQDKVRYGDMHKGVNLVYHIFGGTISCMPVITDYIAMIHQALLEEEVEDLRDTMEVNDGVFWVGNGKDMERAESKAKESEIEMIEDEVESYMENCPYKYLIDWSVDEYALEFDAEYHIGAHLDDIEIKSGDYSDTFEIREKD